MLKLVLFLIGKHNFLFPSFAISIYCTLFLLYCFHFVHGVNLLYFIFVGLFWFCLWMSMYMGIFHYFNYCLPNFVTAICLEFIFGILLVNLTYFVFVGLFWFCLWVYMYMCIFHYFNYYLPDSVTAICLMFIFGFPFWGICFNLTECCNKPHVESSFLTRDQALSLWSGILTPRP